MQKDDVVRLVTASNPQEAHVWQQALAEEGIRAEVVGEYLEAGVGDVPGLRPELWVRRADAERAEAILREHQKAHAPGEDEEEDEGA
jgi:Putative prokaryotic signal transducing protein